MIKNFIPQGFITQHAVCSPPADNDIIFYFDENNILLLKSGSLPLWKDVKPYLGSQPTEWYCFGEMDQERYLLADSLPPDMLSQDNFVLKAVRHTHETLSEPHYRIAGLARQLHHWRSSHRYCGHCGAATVHKADERALLCPQCHTPFYPKLAPCMIVLVTRGPDLLLARSPHFVSEVYSTLAGFIEPGESAEDAVYREVQEEVGIIIKNVRYISSQPWPFPNSLMLGFLAEYAEGEIKIDKVEIEDAQWFKPNHLPKLPSSLSISRLLIEMHLESVRE